MCNIFYEDFLVYIYYVLSIYGFIKVVKINIMLKIFRIYF